MLRKFLSFFTVTVILFAISLSTVLNPANAESSNTSHSFVPNPDKDYAYFLSLSNYEVYKEYCDMYGLLSPSESDFYNKKAVAKYPTTLEDVVGIYNYNNVNCKPLEDHRIGIWFYSGNTDMNNLDPMDFGFSKDEAKKLNLMFDTWEHGADYEENGEWKSIQQVYDLYINVGLKYIGKVVRTYKNGNNPTFTRELQYVDPFEYYRVFLAVNNSKEALHEYETNKFASNPVAFMDYNVEGAVNAELKMQQLI